MTSPTIWHTIAQVGTVTLLVGVGYLLGRWHRHHHQDQVERDAWDDGFREALRAVLFDDAVPLVDEDFPGYLDAAQEQTVPDGWPGLN